MVGMLGSGFRVVSQISGDAFRDIVLSAFRSHPETICGSGGVWFNDAAVDGAAGEVRLVQVSGEPPAMHDDMPIPPIQFDDLASGTFKDLFDFAAWPLVRSRFRNRPHLKTIDGGAIAIGMEIDDGDDQAAFAGFTANHLMINGAGRDFLVAVNGDILTGRVSRGISVIPGPGLPTPMLTGPEPTVKATTVGGDNSQGRGVLWEQPWRFIMDVTLVIGSDESDVRAHGTMWLNAPGDGGLDIHVSVPPSQIEPGSDDDFWPFTSFDNSERNATSAKLAFGIASSLRDALQVAPPPLGNRPDAVRVTAIGEAEARIYDPGFLELPGGGRLPAFFCEGFEISSDGVLLYGSIRLAVPLAPHLVPVPQSVILSESLSSACGGAEPDFGTQWIDLRNTGLGPLIICRNGTGLSGADAARFSLFIPGQNADHQVVQAGDVARASVRYSGTRGVNATAVLTIATNDPSAPRRPIELRVLSGTTSVAIDPPALSVRRANNPLGRPVMRIANCQPQSVRENAAEFRVINPGANPLHICDLVLDDPDGVFVIPFFQRIVDPGSAERFAVLFFPKQAARTYFASCTLTVAGGQQHVLQIDGRVEVLPQPGEPGEWIDVGSGRGCFALEGLCRARGYYEPVADSSVLPIVETMIGGLPAEAELIMRDGQGRIHVRDMSGLPSRSHALAYTPNPDGGAMPGDPCRGEVPGIGPIGPGPGPDPIMTDVEGRLILPDGDPMALGEATVFVAGNLPRLSRPDGLWTLNPQEGVVSFRNTEKISRIDSFAIGRGRAALLVGDRISLHDAGSDELGSRRAEARLDQPARGILLRNNWVLVADAGGVTIFAEQGKRLVQVSRATLPGGVHAMRAMAGGVVALGESSLSFIVVGKDGAVRIATTIKLEHKGSTLSQYRAELLVAGRDSTRSFRIIRGQLHHAAEYPLGHWSSSFLPGGADDLLFRRIDGQRLQRCRVRRHDFDRRRFARAFELRYRPPRP